MIQIKATGDIFACGADVIVNTVNTKGVMGAGIALEFKARYPAMFAEYAKLCKKGKIRVGEVWIWHHEPAPPTYIVNFPTKDHWQNPSRLEWIVAGLDNLKEYAMLDQVTSLAIPALGCHLGGLDFADVSKAVQTALGDLDLEITLYGPQ